MIIKKRGFTLTEVITTFSIVGLVVMIAIPALIARQDKHIWVKILNRDNTIIETIK